MSSDIQPICTKHKSSLLGNVESCRTEKSVILIVFLLMQYIGQAIYPAWNQSYIVQMVVSTKLLSDTLQQEDHW